MSLKTFHLVFIVASIALSAYVAAWGLSDYRASEVVSSLILSVGGALATVLLCGYLGWVVRKLKAYSYFVLALLLSTVPTELWACPTCLSNSNSPLVKAANVGVLFLLGVISTLLVAFGSLFIVWFRRAQRLDEAANGL